jgi:hypothetical protein
MKSRIERGDLRNVFAKDALRHVDGLELKFVVRRCLFGSGGDRGADFGNDSRRVAEFSTVDDAMDNGIDGAGRGSQDGFQIVVRF